MDSKNFLSLDFSNNQELADIFSRTDVGKEACLRVRFLITSKDLAGVKGSIVEIEDDSKDSDYPDKEDAAEGESDGTVEPKYKEPMAISMNITGPVGK